MTDTMKGKNASTYFIYLCYCFGKIKKPYKSVRAAWFLTHSWIPFAAVTSSNCPKLPNTSAFPENEGC